MHEGGTVWIDLADKRRPGVVVEARGELVRVAYGTSNELPGTGAVVVHPDTRAGKKFPLVRTTYFYGANTGWELPDGLHPGAAECARDLFDEIRRLVEEHDACVEET